MAPPTDQSQRVTLAVLGEKMDGLTKTVEQFISKQEKCNDDTDERLKKLESARVSFASFMSVVIWFGVTVGGAIILYMLAKITGQL